LEKPGQGKRLRLPEIKSSVLSKRKRRNSKTNKTTTWGKRESYLVTATKPNPECESRGKKSVFSLGKRDPERKKKPAAAQKKKRGWCVRAGLKLEGAGAGGFKGGATRQKKCCVSVWGDTLFERLRENWKGGSEGKN